MKKTFLLVLSLLTIFIIGGCGDTGNNSSSVATNTSGTTETKMTEKIGDKKTDTFQGKRILIAYFSRADENYRVGYIEKGNTRILAEMLADMTGGELFEIKTVKPYPKEHDPTIELAKQELADNARPEIIGELPKVQDYDLIFLGYRKLHQKLSPHDLLCLVRHALRCFDNLCQLSRHMPTILEHEDWKSPQQPMPMLFFLPDYLKARQSKIDISSPYGFLDARPCSVNKRLIR